MACASITASLGKPPEQLLQSMVGPSIGQHEELSGGLRTTASITQQSWERHPSLGQGCGSYLNVNYVFALIFVGVVLAVLASTIQSLRIKSRTALRDNLPNGDDITERARRSAKSNRGRKARKSQFRRAQQPNSRPRFASSSRVSRKSYERSMLDQIQIILRDYALFSGGSYSERSDRRTTIDGCCSPAQLTKEEESDFTDITSDKDDLGEDHAHGRDEGGNQGYNFDDHAYRAQRVSLRGGGRSKRSDSSGGSNDSVPERWDAEEEAIIDQGSSLNEAPVTEDQSSEEPQRALEAAFAAAEQLASAKSRAGDGLSAADTATEPARPRKSTSSKRLTKKGKQQAKSEPDPDQRTGGSCVCELCGFRHVWREHQKPEYTWVNCRCPDCRSKHWRSGIELPGHGPRAPRDKKDPGNDNDDLGPHSEHALPAELFPKRVPPETR